GEQAKQEAVAHLDEDDFVGHIERRFPAEPFDVEPPSQIEVRHPEGDDVHALVHAPYPASGSPSAPHSVSTDGSVGGPQARGRTAPDSAGPLVTNRPSLVG